MGFEGFIFCYATSAKEMLTSTDTVTAAVTAAATATGIAAAAAAAATNRARTEVRNCDNQNGFDSINYSCNWLL